MQYEKLVYTICFQLVRNTAAAEDLTQETFLAAWLHRDSCPTDHTRQWLCRIAVNKAKDDLRSAWSRHTVLPGDENLPSGLVPPAEETALQSVSVLTLQTQILALREPYQTVCRLCILEERSPETVAELLDRPLKTVYTQLSRGKQILRGKLEDYT